MNSKFQKYMLEGQEFEGFLTWKHTQKNPGVLIFHNFMGQSEFDRDKARELSELGYTCFCADVYGIGKRASSHEEADGFLKALNNDRAALSRRVQGSLAYFKSLDQVDEKRIVAIGFCFGGKCVLDLARSGADLNGVVSFHGVYDRSPETPENPINCSVLILDGWDDPLATPSAKVELAKELTKYKADWQILSFGNTGHAFTNPQAMAKDRNFYFQEKSNQRAWDYAKYFLREKLS